MGIIVFSLAAILSLPKQFITVYLGVILVQSNSGQLISPPEAINHLDHRFQVFRIRTVALLVT
jgi:hypothetical protein